LTDKIKTPSAMVGDSSSGSLTASEPQQWQDSSKKETLESEVFEKANENEAASEKKCQTIPTPLSSLTDARPLE
jgi:hypothetical protein